MKQLRLIALFFKLGTMSEMEYRSNFFIHAWEAIMILATGLSVLWVVFSQTQRIDGWTLNELLMVLGIYFFFYGLINMTISPSIKKFMKDVWNGDLDYILTKPENHQLMASARQIVVWSFTEVLIGIGIAITSLYRLRTSIGFGQSIMFLLTIAAGAIMLYSFWLIIGTLSFWTTKIENLLLVFYSMYEAGRWPVGMYPFWLKYSLVFVVPVALAVTVPAEAVIGRLNWSVVGISLAIAIPQYFFARWFFRFGIRRYSGASA
jgi:ABC-2 type transport system permease protein